MRQIGGNKKNNDDFIQVINKKERGENLGSNKRVIKVHLTFVTYIQRRNTKEE